MFLQLAVISLFGGYSTGTKLLADSPPPSETATMKPPSLTLTLPPVGGQQVTEIPQQIAAAASQQLTEVSLNDSPIQNNVPSSGAGVLNPWLYRFPPWYEPYNPEPPGFNEITSSRSLPLDLPMAKSNIEDIKSKEITTERVTVPGYSIYRTEVVKTILDYILNTKRKKTDDIITDNNNVESFLEFTSTHPNKPTPPSIQASALIGTDTKDGIMDGFDDTTNFEVYNEEDDIVLVISSKMNEEKKDATSSQNNNSKQPATFTPSRLLSLTPASGRHPQLVPQAPDKFVPIKENSLIRKNPQLALHQSLRKVLTSRPVIEAPVYNPLPLENEKPQVITPIQSKSRVKSNFRINNIKSEQPQNLQFIPGVPLPLLLQYIVRSRALNSLAKKQAARKFRDEESYKLRIRTRSPSRIRRRPTSIQDILQSNLDTSEELYRRAKSSKIRNAIGREQNPHTLNDRWTWN